MRRSATYHTTSASSPVLPSPQHTVTNPDQPKRAPRATEEARGIIVNRRREVPDEVHTMERNGDRTRDGTVQVGLAEFAADRRTTYTIAEVASILGISTCTAYECAHTAQLPVLRFGRQRSIGRASSNDAPNELEPSGPSRCTYADHEQVLTPEPASVGPIRATNARRVRIR
jgi:excisionase family DNA binding protein